METIKVCINASHETKLIILFTDEHLSDDDAFEFLFKEYVMKFKVTDNNNVSIID